MTIMEWLDTIDAQAKAATEGPWHHTHKDCLFAMSSDFIDRQDDGPGYGLVASDLNQSNAKLYATEEDMDFIAAARETVPQLVALLREACRLLALTGKLAYPTDKAEVMRLWDQYADYLAKEVEA